MNEDTNATRQVDFSSFSIEMPPGWKQYGGPVPENFLKEAEMHLRCVSFVDFNDDTPVIQLQLHEIKSDGFEGLYLSTYLAHLRAVEGTPRILPATLDGIEAGQVWRVDDRNTHAEYVVYRARNGAMVLLECHTIPLQQDELASAKGSVGRFMAKWRWTLV